MATPADLTERRMMLGAVPLLSELTPHQLEKLAELGLERTISPGVAIVREGEQGLGFYLILRGTAEVQRSGRTVASLSSGEFFGESALLEAQPRTADVLAKTEVRCLTLERRAFWEALGIDPNLNRTDFEEAIRRFRSSRGQLTE